MAGRSEAGSGGRIYDINSELEHAAALAAAKRGGTPRGVRPDVPYPFGQLLPMPTQFGPTVPPTVTDFQTFGLPAAWRAVNLIANGVAQMAPLKCFGPDGIKVLDTPPVAARPNSTITSYAFWHQAVAIAIMRGNFLGILADFDDLGYPRQVVPVPPIISYAVYEAGRTVFYIGGVAYQSHEVVHVPGFLVPGSPWGLGVVGNFRRSIGIALEEQHMAADTYHRGSVPSGVITTDRPRQSSEQAEEVQSQWIQAHGSGQRKPAVLPAEWKFTPLSWSPQDAQFLQSRQFSIVEIAYMFNLDPSDLGAALDSGKGGSITYANIEQREISRTADAYGPWMRRFEEAWSDLIPGGNMVKFQPTNYLRLDAETSATVHQINITTGMETLDEARAQDGKPPFPIERQGQGDPALKLSKEGLMDPASSALNPTGENPPPPPTTPGAPQMAPAPHPSAPQSPEAPTAPAVDK